MGTRISWSSEDSWRRFYTQQHLLSTSPVQAPAGHAGIASDPSAALGGQVPSSSGGETKGQRLQGLPTDLGEAEEGFQLHGL